MSHNEQTKQAALPPAPSPIRGLFPSEFEKKNTRTFTLLWGGLGVSVVLNAFDYSLYVSAGAGLLIFSNWLIQNIDLAKIVFEFFYFLADIFFREISCRGEHKIPATGPVLLCCGPHSNQFLDGIIVSSVCSRSNVGFVVAEVSLQRKYVGKIIKMVDPIGVNRPQDIAVPGQGQVKVRGLEIEGQGTNFTEKDVGCTIFVNGASHQQKITEVVNETLIRTTYPCEEDDDKDANSESFRNYKIAPNVPMDKLLVNVVKRVTEGKVVAIFPEGGSHDQTHLLDLKPGIAMIALSAAAELNMSVPIVPVGLTYFQGHRFRSRAFVDIGDPYYVTEQEVNLYKSGKEGKREAIGNLMKRITNDLEQCLVGTEDYEELQLLWALRRLYVPSSNKLSGPEKQELTRRLANGFKKSKEEARIRYLMKAVKLYTNLLKQYGLHDYMVAKKFSNLAEKDYLALCQTLAKTFAYRIVLLVLSVTCWIPSGILALPFVLVARYVSAKKAREAVAKSSVKIKGRDVIGTWKIIVALVFVPALHFFYSIMVWILFGYEWMSAYFFFMPVISIMNFKTEENIVRVARSLRPLLMIIMDYKKTQDLSKMRQWCVEETVACVEDFKMLPQDEDQPKFGIPLSPSAHSLKSKGLNSSTNSLGDRE